MKNTEKLCRDALTRVNSVRRQEYEKIRQQIKKLTMIDLIIRSMIRRLEQDPSYVYGNEPICDLGPCDPEDSVPVYTPEPGRENCALRDFSPMN